MADSKPITPSGIENPPFQDDLSAQLSEAQAPTRTVTRLPAALAISHFMTENHIVMKPGVAPAGPVFIGSGFVLADKPLLTMDFEYVD